MENGLELMKRTVVVSIYNAGGGTFVMSALRMEIIDADETNLSPASGLRLLAKDFQHGCQLATLSLQPGTSFKLKYTPESWQMLMLERAMLAQGFPGPRTRPVKDTAPSVTILQFSSLNPLPMLPNVEN